MKKAAGLRAGMGSSFLPTMGAFLALPMLVACQVKEHRSQLQELEAQSDLPTYDPAAGKGPRTPIAIPSPAVSPNPAVSPAPSPGPSGPPNSVAVSATVLQTLPDDFLGVNIVAFWGGYSFTAKAGTALAAAGFKHFRFPGGVPATFYDWSQTSGNCNNWSAPSPSDMWNFAAPLGASMMFQTNPTAQGQCNNDYSGAHAAGWVRDSASKGMRVPYWEIGNEPEMESTFQNNLDLYATRFNDQAAAIHVADPVAQVYGPSTTNINFWGNVDGFLAKTGNKQGTGSVDGVSLHFYPFGGDYPMGSAGAGWLDYFPGAIAGIKASINKYDSRNLPIAITETSGNSAQMSDAIQGLELLGQYTRYGVSHVEWFCSSQANQWGILPGDNPSPAYYGLVLWSKVGTVVLDLNQGSNYKYQVSSYAFRKASGAHQVLMLNKTAQTQAMTVQFSGVNLTGKSVAIYSLKPGNAGNVSSPTVSYNGAINPDPASLPGPASDTSAGATYTYALPAYNAVLLEFAP